MEIIPDKFIFKIRHQDRGKNYEIDSTNDSHELLKLKQLIRSQLQIDAEFTLSWSRASSPNDFITINDDKNLKRCIDSQLSTQRAPAASELFVTIHLNEEQIRPQVPIVSSGSRDLNLSKSTQIQIRNMKPEFAQSESAPPVPPASNSPALQVATYDRTKYTDFSCYNCGGGENGPIDLGCPVCFGVGKLLKSKEIDAIEYLVEKKLCSLFPELKTVFKRFQSPSIPLSEAPKQEVQEPTTQESVAKPITAPVEKKIENDNRKKKKQQQFDSLFGQKEVNNNAESTPKPKVNDLENTPE